MTSKKINLDGSSHKQLIDLNGEAVNFSLEFVITPGQPDKDKPYAIAIITQDKLDTDSDINFATVKGQFRKTLDNMSNVYQNLCLIINSDVKFVDPVEIDIQLTDLGVSAPQKPQQKVRSQDHPQPPAPTAKPETGNKKMKYILGVLILIIGACLLYYFWTQSKKKVEVVIPQVETTIPTTVADTKPVFSFY